MAIKPELTPPTQTAAERPKVDDVILPDELRGTARDKVKSMLTELFVLATAVLDASEAVRPAAKEKFETRVSQFMDDDPEASRFLLGRHTSLAVNWIGYVRGVFGPEVGGRTRIPLGLRPRGVGDKSGKKSV